jgi:hypothetical protein
MAVIDFNGELILEKIRREKEKVVAQIKNEFSKAH